MTKYCDAFGVRLSISHALECKKEDLITTHYNKLRNRFAELARNFFTIFYVQNNPLIHTDFMMLGVKTHMVGKQVTKNPLSLQEDL